MTEVINPPFKITRELSKYYLADARDFIERFDILWDEPLRSKTGRVKRFVDLLMAVECILKSHIFFYRINDNPEECYKQVRGMGHNISRLADTANSLNPCDSYLRISEALKEFSVFLRYSADMSETFFPIILDDDSNESLYWITIGNIKWVLSIREQCQDLIDSVSELLSDEYCGIDLQEIIDHGKEMKEFVEECMKKY